MYIQKRHSKNKRLILLTHRLSVGKPIFYDDEAKHFDTSTRTIRRDIDEIGKYLDLETITIKNEKRRRRAIILRIFSEKYTKSS